MFHLSYGSEPIMASTEKKISISATSDKTKKIIVEVRNCQNVKKC